MLNKTKKILVVTNGNIGDFVMATGALKLLKQNCINCNITLIVNIKVKSFIENMDLADEIIYTDFSFSKKIIFQRIDQIKWFFTNFLKLKRKKFDDCVFLDHSRFFAKAIWLLRIKNLTGPMYWWCGNNIKNPNIHLLTTGVLLPKNSDKVHLSQRYQTIVRSYTKTFNLAMSFLPKTTKETFENVKKIFKKEKKYSIVLCLNGENIKGNKRIYPLEHTIEIINTLNKLYDVEFIFVGTKTNFDYAQKIMKACNAKIVNLCSKTNLQELKCILENSNLLISVDTGVIHIGATTKINIIGLYGPVLYNSMPASSKAICLYTGEKCSPCHYTRTVLGIPCKYGDNPICLKNITPKMVIDAVGRIYNQ